MKNRMTLSRPQDLFTLSTGNTVTKRNLFDLIQYSKVESSPFWSGEEFMIGNTPQQGINWVGQLPAVKAVIIKIRVGAYKLDGWIDQDKNNFKYSFKTVNGKINFNEKANQVLIKQPEYGYPIMLFFQHKDGRKYEGDFVVNSLEDEFVILKRHASNKKNTSINNPPWKRDELILALELYFKEPDARGNERHKSVVELSRLLNYLPINSGFNSADTFRNKNGVGMKLRNFLAYDPEYEGTALSRGSKLEKEIWDEYSTNIDELFRVADAIRVNSSSAELSLVTNLDADYIEEVSEGQILTRVHIARERNKKIVNTKKNNVLVQMGKLECEVCGFDFNTVYGEIGKGFAECHHVKPVSELKPGDTTKLDDLSILCANCHRMIHRSRPWKTVNELKEIMKRW